MPTDPPPKAQSPVTVRASANSTPPIPIRTLLLQSLTSHTTLLTSLLQSLPSSPHSIPPLHASLIETSTILSNIIATEVDRHQSTWKEALNAGDQVRKGEEKIRKIVARLESGRREIEGLVVSGRETLLAIDKSEATDITQIHPSSLTTISFSFQGPLSVPLLLSHAHALARTTSAPAPFSSQASISTSTAGGGINGASQSLPWPGEAAMRMGLLFQLEGSMSGVGDVGLVADEEEKEERRRADIVEESSRKYDPNAVFQLELNSDESDDD